ncbi:hypothetical protein BGX26_012941 [Mortierella sp. AD094]|nr:hypothetical protein BGX26_012941 [Mortierella sp. AD094]
MSGRKHEEMGEGLQHKRRKASNSSSITEKSQLDQRQYVVRRMELNASELLKSYSKTFKLATYSTAVDALHRILASIEASGSSEQRTWATGMRKALKDTRKTRELKSLFKRTTDAAQDSLVDAIVVGTANALENAIPPILENVGKRVLERAESNSSSSSLSTCSTDSAQIARQLFVSDKPSHEGNPFIVKKPNSGALDSSLHGDVDHDDETQDDTDYEDSSYEDNAYDDEEDDAIPADVEIPSSHRTEPRVVVLDGIDISHSFNLCHHKIASMETLKVATHADELLLLNDILVMHDDKEQGPIMTESGLASCLARYKQQQQQQQQQQQDAREPTLTNQYHLDHEQQGKLISVAMELTGLPQDRRPASVVYPQYRVGYDTFNMGLEMLYQFSCHLEKFPTSARTESTFVAHSVMAMLSPIQNDPRQHLIYDQVSKVFKRRRPDIRLIESKKEIFFGEVTSPERASDRRKVSIDLVRLGRFMKGAINNGVSVVAGVHVEGNVARFYQMELKGPGIYILQQYGTFHLPQQYNQLGQVMLYFKTILKTQSILDRTKVTINQPPPSTLIEWVRPQMDTPTLNKYF